VDTDGDDSLMSPLSVTITDDVQVMASGDLTIEEPTVADLAAGTPTTSVFDVLTSASADGASVTQFTYDGTAYSLDPNDATEQEFTFTEGSLFITTQGEVRFEPTRDLDHSAGDIVKNIVVTSSDGDDDVLTSTVTLTITDGDVPTIDVIPPISLSETNLADGSDPSGAAVSQTETISFTNESDDVERFRIATDEFNSSGALMSNGLEVELREFPADSGQYTGFTTNALNQEVEVFTINFDDVVLGRYTFALLEALVHEDGLVNNSLSFDLPVYAVDSDGDDSVMSPLTVTIEDDVQGMSNGILTIEEPTVADLAAGVVTTTTIDVMPEQSADGATITEFTYDGGTPLTLDQTDTGEQEFVFAEGSLFITLEGDVRFEPNRNLDHTVSEDIVKSIVVTSSDLDNDVVTSTVTLTITDGDIPIIESVPSVTLSETQLADGSTPSGSAVSQTETISFTNQSDDVEKFRIEPTEFNVGGALTSNNIAVELKEDPADSGIYVGFIDDGGTDVPVFSLSFSGTTLGEYTFTLLEALDHADGLDNNDLSFDLPVYAVDSDGDDSLMSPLSVTIGDDVQIMANGTLDITEPNLADGTVSTNTIDVMTAQSADGSVITQFTYDGGTAQTLDPTITDEQEFTFTEGSMFVTIEGNVRFEPNRDLDHESGDIVKSLVFTSSDGDADVETATVTLTITDGDIPTIESVPSIALAEADLADGSLPIMGAVSQTETISFTHQSDNVEKFRLEPSEFNSDDSLKSDGLPIDLKEDPAGSGNYVGFTTSASNVETPIFTLSFNAATLGQYTFTLLENIDHEDGRGNNDFTFELPVYAVDTDGDDSLMSPLSVTITDDVQVMVSGSLSIEEPTVADLAAGTPATSVFDVLTSASADGASVTQFTYDGTAYSLDPSDATEQEFTFTEGSLFITTQGEVRFEPNRDLDHSAGDIVKNIVVTSSDGDSDVLTSTVTLTITDGDVPTIDIIPPISLSETNLADGSDPSNSAVSDTKVIQFTHESDDVEFFRIEPTEFNTLGELTLNNLAVQLKEDPNSAGDYIGFVKDASDVETNVFTISFSDTNLGQYTFTLLEALDHEDGLDNNTLSFDLPIYAVDSDGDDSLMSPLTVTIEDDVQGMSNGILTIEEPTVADLAAGVVTTTTIDVMPEQSADGATITEFTYGGGTPLTLDQTDTGEQEFVFAEGSLFITLEGDVRFEPNRDLDHESGPIVKSIVVTSSDGDVDVETATVVLTITDGDIPTIESVPSVTLSETQLADGSTPSGSAVSQTETISFTNQSDDVEKFRIEPTEFNVGGALTSNNIAVELKEDPADSGIYTGFIDDGGTDVPVFSLSFSGTTLGEYTFTLLEALDHADGLDNNELTFDLPVYAVDSDGDDSLMSPLSVTIGDDVQIMANGTLDITEPNLADGTVTTNTIDVMTAQSADGAVITQFTYDGGTAQTLDPTITGEQKFTFTEGDVFVTIEGNVRFEPNRDLDHESGDIVKSLVFTSSDGDVDVETATVTLTIIDGDIPTIESVPSIALAEADLADGSSPIMGAVSQTETISFTNQSDDVEKFRLELSEFNSDDSLKSDGLPIDLKEDPAGSGNYVGFTTSASNVETQIFTLSFSAATLGQYTFTLLENIDHEDGRGNNDFTFELPVYAVDSDGDDSLMSPLSVTITDDVQEMANGSLNIEEPTVTDLAAGTPTTSVFDVLTSPSADGASVTQFTYDGTAYSLDPNDATEQEFTFTEGSLFITTQGEVRFEPNRDLDHSAGDIVKSIVVTSSDGDDDVLTSTLTLTITDGDVPTIDVIPPISLSETNLADGSEPSNSAVSDTKVIQFTHESDDVESFRIEPTEFNTLGTLTSNNLAVQLKEDPNSAGDYIGFVKDASDVETNVFTVTFSGTNLGQYTFTLLEALDHEDGLVNNSLSFDLPVYAVDSDGDDSLVSQLNVTIGDDVQIMQDGTLDITEPNLADGTITTSTIDVMPEQSADGATITEFTYDGGTPLTLDQADTGEQEFIFTEGSLFITLEGDVRFEPNRNLDHTVSEDIVKSIVVTSSDGDVDVETATVVLTIADGDIPTIESVPSVTLSETQLADGSTPSGSAVSQTETISFTNQSDDVEKFRIEPTEFNVGGALTSNNIAVELKEDPADSGIYTGFIDDGGTDVPVFSLSFSGTTLGEYTFTLLEALDHADGLDNNDLTFDLPVYAVDSDGDDSLMSPLSVTIGDDVQIMANGTLDITEPNLADGTVTTNTIDVMTAQSADGAVITQFTYDGGTAQTLDPTITGEQKFTFTEGDVFVTIEGNVRFEPNRDLDHESGDIVKSLVFTSSDGDIDVETATVTLTIIDGDIPTIESVPSIALAEADLADGSSPIMGAVSQTETISFTHQSDDVEKFRLEPSEFNTNNALKSDGLIIEIREEPTGSGNYIGFTTDISNVETTVFTLDFSSSTLGEYTFTLLEAIDHTPIQGNNDLTFNLPVYAVDTDGDDSLMSPLSVTITDDVQVMASGDLTIEEPTVADLAAGTPTTSVFDVLTFASADGASVTQFTYDGTAYSLNPNDATEQEFTFTEGSLFITTQGEVRFEPNRDLDHSAGDIVKSIVVTSSDGDDDVLTSTVTLTITDGDVPTIDVIPPISLSETNLADGSDPSNSAVSDTKVIQFTHESDDVESFRIEPTEFNTLGTLTSNNLAVQLKEDPNSAGDYIGFVKDASDVETNVFTVTFSGTNLGQYTFTLLEALDHEDGLVNNSLSFDLPVYAVDSDGDDSLVSQLNVTIGDDVQIMQDGTLDITEPNLADGTITTSTIDVMPEQSADGATITEFTYDGGTPLTLDQADTGEQEFIFTEGSLFITLEGEVRFEPNRNLDHTVSEDIVKSIVVTSSDLDNDVVTSTVTLTITDGNIPTIESVPSMTLSETQLADGSTPSGSAVSQTETISFTHQSDDVEKFRIEPTEFNVGGALTSNNIAVELKE
ncbi:hypothetical protein IQQ51_12935, partial [Vibrio sp. OPT18]|nr:hypothetical protein [Vibrio sp. OPT18]